MTWDRIKWQKFNFFLICKKVYKNLVLLLFISRNTCSITPVWLSSKSCQWVSRTTASTNFIERHLKPRLYEDGGLLKGNIFLKFHWMYVIFMQLLAYLDTLLGKCLTWGSVKKSLGNWRTPHWERHYDRDVCITCLLRKNMLHAQHCTLFLI